MNSLFGECEHERKRLMKGYCANGAVQVREMCPDCGVNVRGGGVNIPHREVSNIELLPLLFDHRQAGHVDAG